LLSSCVINLALIVAFDIAAFWYVLVLSVELFVVASKDVSRRESSQSPELAAVVGEPKVSPLFLLILLLSVFLHFFLF